MDKEMKYVWKDPNFYVKVWLFRWAVWKYVDKHQYVPLGLKWGGDSAPEKVDICWYIVWS